VGVRCELSCEFPHALPHGVLRLEAEGFDAVEVHVIRRPWVFVSEVRDVESTVEFVLNDLGDLRDLVVLVLRADVVDEL
jgi:hypothetical protein